MTQGRVRIETEEVSPHAVIGTVVIDNPSRRNAMTAAMYQSVPAAVGELTADPRLRVVVVRGAGGHAFSAGSDISEFGDRRLGPDASDYDATEHAAWAALAGIEVPVIAAIQGPCRGGGVALALHCDLRIAADDASFATPPARIGIAYPAEAAQRLVAVVGPAHAKKMLFTAAVFGADDAHRMGLADEVVPAAQLDRYVTELAHHLARLAPLSLRAAKAVVDNRADAAQAVRACYDSNDFREGIRAFADKRDAVFDGT